ncbi:AP endonuclease, family 2 [Lentisphaera araneosa HTCC2155]|uniref:AP endonuclease, family 2 n=1 Tax=Lentisphaera araneosa HTCC2155 TaxID=313628 RepID=A6DN28_9BACT|nr:sugar phosphate isomerase/epimerase family protein [Lentisphaera araneosa]EDM27064.1 AP endonuclease, family 2 [Lentisphaera araneosa HTCC2155]
MSHSNINRRHFIAASALAALASSCKSFSSKPELQISLAQYSLHRGFFGKSGYKKLDSLDFPKITRSLDIAACEYVGAFFPGRKPDLKFSKEMNKRSQDFGIENLLVMVDGNGNLGDPSSSKRDQAVANHRKWLEAAAELNCHSIRVNARSQGSTDEQRKLLADGMSKLCAEAKEFNMNILIENHGGLSSDGEFLASLMKEVNLDNFGTLPDFGNFWDRESKTLFDPYAGTKAMLPYAKALSAKTYDLVPGKKYTVKNRHFGYEIDVERMMKLTVESAYKGWIGIEYEGTNPSKNEIEGIQMSKKILEELWAKYQV